jgi:exonuclease SbcC
MKILNLKFKNINSLSGENEIDFTSPVFTNDGLFAITGKTGAGKSSILDAISLALYGKTPRVDITGNENAVMTRGEKDCYAEIVFEVAGKKWKSSWKQERARTGTLKQIERIVADENDKIVADKIFIKGERKNADEKTVNEKIEELIGLSFEQFTKVIMLAQGSFAAFLQADKNDKGQLLEQITGTEIYAKISQIVFERNRTEKEKLDKILLELEIIKILSDEAIEKLVTENVIIEKEKIQVDEELLKIETAKKWLSDLANLQTQINGAKEKLPELEEQTKTATQTFEKYAIELKTVKDEQIRQEPIFKKIRELDTKISEKEKLLNPILKFISELEENIKALSNTLDSQSSELDTSEKSLVEKQKWETANKKYEDLVLNYSAIEKENQVLVDLFGEIENHNSAILELQTDYQTKLSVVKKAVDSFSEIDETLTKKTKELDTRKSELSKILNGKELSEYQSEKENTTNIGIHIKNLIEARESISVSEKEIAGIVALIKEKNRLANDLDKKIKNHKVTLKLLENQINLLDENIGLTKTILSLDEHRHNLEDGKDCPLCGSKKHPYAVGNVPKIGKQEKELIKLEEQFKETTNANQQDEKELTKLESEAKSALNNKDKEEKSLIKNKNKQTTIISEIKKLQFDFSFTDDESIKIVYQQKQIEYKQLDEIIKNAERSEKSLTDLRDKEIPALQKEKDKVEKEKNNLETSLKVIKQQIEDRSKLVSTAQEKHEKENAVFVSKLEKYEVKTIEALKKRLDAWNENKKQVDEITEQITTIKNNIALSKQEIESLTKSFNEKQKDFLSINADNQKLSNERREIFESKSVEEEENRLKKLIETSEYEKVNSEKTKNEINTQFEKNKAIVSEKEKELLKTQEQKITEKTNEELQSEFDEKKIKSDDFSQKIGANKQTLKSNDDNLKRSGSKLNEKVKQQEVYSKWAKLNDLIGSSDGKKYRNFVQTLTFEHLVDLSNGQLKKMSDRYLLKRTGNSSNPYDLSVIDKYQNNDERTSQNLSGGEKFIVSLSLALGLSGMVSKNMRIDTMFIDEGFGTLDSDYLDVALNALSNLQSEGKIIGVISHLAELKERIATHIEVIPSGNGHSKIHITN